MAPVERKPVSYVSLGVGAFMQMVEVTTLGQPFEVVKTTMAGIRLLSIPPEIFLTFSKISSPQPTGS